MAWQMQHKNYDVDLVSAVFFQAIVVICLHYPCQIQYSQSKNKKIKKENHNFTHTKNIDIQFLHRETNLISVMHNFSIATHVDFHVVFGWRIAHFFGKLPFRQVPNNVL